MAYKQDIRRVLSKKSKKTPPSDARSKNMGGKAGYGFSVEVAPGRPGMRYRPGLKYPDYPRRRKARKPDSYQHS